VDQATTGSFGARNEARVLALLESDEAGGLTIAALREHGIQAPGQAVYALELAGHKIDRVNCEDSDGPRAWGTACAPPRPLRPGPMAQK
jgi:hypothetical protein